MNKIIFPFLLAAILLLPQFALAGNLINVTFQSGPALFGETNFLPGDSVTKWARVANISASPVSITVVFENYDDPNNMGSQYDVVIKKHNASDNLFSGTMAALNASGGVLLDPVLAAKSETQYDFSVVFRPAAGNDYQNKSLKFDMAIAASGQGGQEVEIFGGVDGGGGGGGGSFYLGPTSPTGNTGPGGGLAFIESGSVAGETIGTKPEGTINGAAFAFKPVRGPAQTDGEVLGESTTAASIENRFSQCSPHYWWWYLGYLLFALLLALVLWLERGLNKLPAYFVPVILLAAGILWWWFEPCPKHWLGWPLAMVIYFFALVFWHHKYQLYEAGTQQNLPFR